LYKLNLIDIENFLSIGKAKIDFTALSYPLLIQGLNMDLGRSNGSGKTTILNAICYALWGRTLIKFPMELLNNSKIYLQLSDTENNRNILHISRSRMSGKEELTVNNNGKILEGNTNTQIQKQLNALFGIHKDMLESEYFLDFINSVFISNSTIDTFASGAYSPKDRMDLLCRIINLDFWDAGIEKAKLRKTKLETDIEIKKSNLEYIQNSIAGATKEEIEKTIQDLDDQLDYHKTLLEDHKCQKEQIDKQLYQKNQLLNQRESINRNIVNLRDAFKKKVDASKFGIADSEKAIREAEDWMKQYHDENINIEKIDIEIRDIDDRLAKLREFQIETSTKLFGLSNKITSLKEKITINERQLQDIKKCPQCGSNLLILKNDILNFDTRKVEEENNSILGEIATIEQEKIIRNTISDKNKADIIKLQDDRNIYENKQRTWYLLDKKKETIKVNLDRIKQEQNIMDALEADHQKQLHTFSSELDKVDTHIAEINKMGNLQQLQTEFAVKITEFEDSVSKINQRLGVETNKLENYEIMSIKTEEYKKEIELLAYSLSNVFFWLDAFKDIKRNIVDNFIPLLEGKTNDNIKKAGMTYTVEFDTLKTTQSGGIRQEFNIKVVDDSGKARVVDTLSDGERKTLAICISLAIADYKSETGAMPFYFKAFDEVVDGIDYVGQQAIAKLFSERKEQLLIISHSNLLQELIPNILTVIKKDGVSSVR
jgi:DNA repair exonuclease SbcCD ATPase subunit